MQLFSVFVTNKFKLMSSCVICLVIAREIFLPQPDCSVNLTLTLTLLIAHIQHIVQTQ